MAVNQEKMTLGLREMASDLAHEVEKDNILHRFRRWGIGYDHPAHIAIEHAKKDSFTHQELFETLILAGEQPAIKVRLDGQAPHESRADIHGKLKPKPDPNYTTGISESGAQWVKYDGWHEEKLLKGDPAKRRAEVAQAELKTSGMLPALLEQASKDMIEVDTNNALDRSVSKLKTSAQTIRSLVDVIESEQAKGKPKLRYEKRLFEELKNAELLTLDALHLDWRSRANLSAKNAESLDASMRSLEESGERHAAAHRAWQLSARLKVRADETERTMRSLIVNINAKPPASADDYRLIELRGAQEEAKTIAQAMSTAIDNAKQEVVEITEANKNSDNPLKSHDIPTNKLLNVSEISQSRLTKIIKQSEKVVLYNGEAEIYRGGSIEQISAHNFTRIVNELTARIAGVLSKALHAISERLSGRAVPG